eukprot:4552677-Pyramimonas_sp.AAC.1
MEIHKDPGFRGSWSTGLHIPGSWLPRLQTFGPLGVPDCIDCKRMRNPPNPETCAITPPTLSLAREAGQPKNAPRRPR